MNSVHSAPIDPSGNRARADFVERVRHRREAAVDVGADHERRRGAQVRAAGRARASSGRSTRATLDNPLLFPTFSATVEAFFQGLFGGDLFTKALTSLQGAADRLRRRHRCARRC